MYHSVHEEATWRTFFTWGFFLPQHLHIYHMHKTTWTWQSRELHLLHPPLRLEADEMLGAVGFLKPDENAAATWQGHLWCMSFVRSEGFRKYFRGTLSQSLFPCFCCVGSATKPPACFKALGGELPGAFCSFSQPNYNQLTVSIYFHWIVWRACLFINL